MREEVKSGVRSQVIMEAEVKVSVTHLMEGAMNRRKKKFWKTR